MIQKHLLLLPEHYTLEPKFTYDTEEWESLNNGQKDLFGTPVRKAGMRSRPPVSLFQCPSTALDYPMLEERFPLTS